MKIEKWKKGKQGVREKMDKQNTERFLHSSVGEAVI